MVYFDSWWPYILVGISFFAFFVLIVVLCRHRLRVCPPTGRYDDNGSGGYPRSPGSPAGDAALSGCHQRPAMDQATVTGGFHTMTEVTTFSGGGSPVDVIILPPPYYDQAPPSYSDAIKTHAANSMRTLGDQPRHPSRTS